MSPAWATVELSTALAERPAVVQRTVPMETWAQENRICHLQGGSWAPRMDSPRAKRTAKGHPDVQGGMVAEGGAVHGPGKHRLHGAGRFDGDMGCLMLVVLGLKGIGEVLHRKSLDLKPRDHGICRSSQPFLNRFQCLKEKNKKQHVALALGQMMNVS